jgi:hypothetical protein
MNTVKRRKRRTPQERLAAVDLMLSKLAQRKGCPNRPAIANFLRTIHAAGRRHPDEVLKVMAQCTEQVIEVTRLELRYPELRNGFF